jgi:glycosyltransferase involved in cell wall biosynthesis
LQTVLYVNRIAEIGGAEVSLLNLVQEIQKYDYSPVVVLGSEGPLSTRLKQLDVNVYTYPLDVPHFKNPIPFLRSVLFLHHVINNEKARLIHSNALWDNQYGVVVAKLAGIPHILHVRGFPEQQASWKSFYNMGSLAICNSEDTKRKFLKYSGFRKRTEVVYNGVDTERFIPDQESRQKVRQRYDFGEADFVMGMAGRLTEEKGQLFLLKTLLPMLKDNSNYKLLIAGDAKIHPDTTYPEKIASFIQHSGLNGNVIMTDYIENMNSFYNALDLFLLPSFREPFGRVLIEAMATETPVIASRVGGVPEVVDHEVNGYLVEPGDAVGWREYINRLIHNEAIRRNFIKSGRNKVLKKFTSENITSSIAALYGELLGDH